MNPRRTRLPLVLLLLMILSASAPAADIEGRTGVGLDFGWMTTLGGDRHYENVDERFSLHLRHGLSPHWSLEAGLMSGWLKPGVAAPDAEADFSRSAALDLYTIFWAPRLGVRYAPHSEKSLVPFVGAGLGIADVRVKDMRGVEKFGGLYPAGHVVEGYDEDGELVELHTTHLTADLNAGLEYFVNPDVSLNLTARYTHLFGSDRDNVGLSAPDLFGPAYADINNGLTEVSLGVTWYFGANDGDGDGIRNSVDACPDAAEDFDGFEDADGCPDLDNDGDGVPDTADACPDAAEDFDGFEDADGCPDPDNDGDGVPDTADACPNAAEDLDGFEDADGCPDPDNDGDGVPDTADACPNTPAGVTVDATGCPVVEEIREELILDGVTFENGSATLTAASATVLDGVAESLIAWPEVRIVIQGHTDSKGSARHNQELSQRRAEAVLAYLAASGVAAGRMEAQGYGETSPTADNATAAGRAANRRVEIHPVK